MPLLVDDSFILRSPASLPARERVWLEAVGFSIGIADLAYDRMREILWAAAAEKSLPLGARTIPAIVSDAWSYVDSCHRLGDMIARGMGQFKTPQLANAARQFRDAAQAVFALRNLVQHLPNETTELERNGTPVWGSVSWVAVISTEPPLVRVCAVMAGGGGPTVSNQLVNPLGKTFRSRVDHVHLAAFGQRVSLAQVHETLACFARELEATVSAMFPGDARSPASGLIFMDVI